MSTRKQAMKRVMVVLFLTGGFGILSFSCSSHLSTRPAAQTLKWDDTINRGWPLGFAVVHIASSVDTTRQPAFFYAGTASEKRPLLVSLHTWSGTYQQEDPLAAKAKAADWNYIHPDFRGPNRSREACLSPKALADIDDAIQYALDHGSVDPDAIFVVGVSGGGYAVLGTYMKTRHTVRAFLSWAPLSDVLAWYWQSKQRQNKYSDDILHCISDQGTLDEKEAIARSPLHWDLPAQARGLLEIYAGLNDGYTGSIPISHSILFFNKMAGHYEAGAVVGQQEIVDLLTRGVANRDAMGKIEGREVLFSRKTKQVSLTIFSGGHEMLVDYCFARLQAIAVQPPGSEPPVPAAPDTH